MKKFLKLNLLLVVFLPILSRSQTEEAASKEESHSRIYILEWLEREPIAGNRSNYNVNAGGRRARAFADNLRKRIGELQRRANNADHQLQSQGAPLSATEKLEQRKYMTGSMAPAQMDVYEAELNQQYELWENSLRIAAVLKWEEEQPSRKSAARWAKFRAEEAERKARQADQATETEIEFRIEEVERKAREAEFRAREAEIKAEEAERKAREAESRAGYGF